LRAQEAETFSDWMKAKNVAASALIKMPEKTGPEAIRHAETIAVIFENMIPFWRQHGAADAMKWSEQGKAAAVQLASAAYGGNLEQAAAAFKVVGGTCRPCHAAYRLRLQDGTYAIRQERALTQDQQKKN
jgi:cytochrome c556